MADEGRTIRGVKHAKATSSDRKYVQMSFIKRYTNKVLRALFRSRDQMRRERDE